MDRAYKASCSQTGGGRGMPRPTSPSGEDIMNSSVPGTLFISKVINFLNFVLIKVGTASKQGVHPHTVGVNIIGSLKMRNNYELWCY